MLFFLANLLPYLFWLAIFGGLPVAWSIFYPILVDRYEDYKKSQYSKTQQFVVLRIFPPAQNVVSMHSMEEFFNSVWSIYRERTPFKLYTLGRSYDTVVVEFHSRGGFVGIFMRMNRSNKQMVTNQLVDRFPGTRVVEVSDPLLDLPREWDRKGKYSQLYATDMKVKEAMGGKENDLLTLKSWKEFQTKDKEPVSDPVVQLFGFMRDIDPRSYVVLQFMLRPLYDKKKVDSWKKEFQERKTEFSGDKGLKMKRRQRMISTTPVQKKMLSDISRKINSLNYLCKIRAVAMAEEGVDMTTLKYMIWSYFNQYSSELAQITPQKDTQSTAESKGDYLGILGPYVGVFLDKAFYEKERYFREKMVYNGLIRRNIDVGSKYYYLDTESLAAMIHFPYITPEVAQKRAMQVRADPEGGAKYQHVFRPQPPEGLPS